MLLKVNKIIENDDGSAEMNFEVDDEFIEWFKKKEGLKRWSQKRFEKFVFKALKGAAEKTASPEELPPSPDPSSM